jgi:membrane protein DedA with SNARE-associated domain
MFAAFVDWLHTLDQWVVLLVTVLSTAVETTFVLGLFVPGESVVTLAAGLPGGFAPAVGAGTVGAMAGQILGYGIGRALGPRLRGTRLGRRIGEQRWQRAEDYLHSRGASALVAVRFLAVVHAVVPIVAGVVKMPFGRFVAWSTVGTALWVALFAAVGLLGGGDDTILLLVAVGVSLLGAVPAAGRLLFRRRVTAAKPRPGTPNAPRAGTAFAGQPALRGAPSGEASSRPGDTRPVPGGASSRPGAAPSVLGATPSDPGAAPSDPGAAPSVPGAAPSVPGRRRPPTQEAASTCTIEPSAAWHQTVPPSAGRPLSSPPGTTSLVPSTGPVAGPPVSAPPGPHPVATDSRPSDRAGTTTTDNATVTAAMPSRRRRSIVTAARCRAATVSTPAAAKTARSVRARSGVPSRNATAAPPRSRVAAQAKT